MSVEAVLVNVVVVTAMAAATVKFVLFEWEGVVQAWNRVIGARKPRRPPSVNSAKD